LTDIGKSVRMERIMNRETERTVIVPMDHGVTLGPIRGLIDMTKTVEQVADGGANAVLGHRGLPKFGHRHHGRDIGLILHLSASTKLAPDPNNKVLVMTVEEAIRFGADAVSVHINVGADNESDMLAKLGRVSKKCMYWGMPLLAMMYPRGQKVPNEYDVDAVKLAARVGAELGADIVKTNYTGDIDSFREVVDGCLAPIVIAGGPTKGQERDFLETVWGSIQAGAAGTSIGRNVFQARNPTKMVKAVSGIVHDGLSVDEALKLLS
jgi:fructose-bisphosphate aldolase/2-amino-3,7-dideoxy-D-threo-hept-6-ulosonate synthase